MLAVHSESLGRKMGNRAYLYLQSGLPSDQEADGRQLSTEIANANGSLPALWQVLLAEGKAMQPDTTQRVFGDAGTMGLASEASNALARVRALAAYVQLHAASCDAPQVQQLTTAASYLQQRIDALAAQGANSPLWISANLDELAWLHDGGAAAYIEHARLLCNARWQALCEAMASDDVDGVLRGLDLPAVDNDDNDNNDEDSDYEDNDDEDDEDDEDNGDDEHSDDTHLGHGLYRYVVNNLQGVRIGAEDGGPVVVPPQFESIWSFEDGIAAVLLDGKLGLIDTDGRRVLPCCLDEVWSYSQGLVMARIGDDIGFVDKAGAWVIPPRFEAAGDFSPGGLAPAYESGQWGLINQRGDWVVAPAWDDIDWDDALHAYVTQRASLSGLIDAQGRVVLDAQYAALGPLDTEPDGAALWAEGRMRIRALTDDDKRGVFDGQGCVVVPVAYTDLADVIWLPSDSPADITPAPAAQEGRYVRVLQCIEHEEWDDWVQGIYDTRDRREVLPCRQQRVFGLKWRDGFGWFCTQRPETSSPHSPDGMNVGIAAADGVWLHEPVYAWIGVAAAMDTIDGIEGGPPAIALQWSQGEPVPAMRADTGQIALLYADGRTLTA